MTQVAPPKKKSTARTLVILVFVVACLMGIAFVAIGAMDTTKKSPVLLMTDEPIVVPSAAKPASGMISEGVWPVGIAGGLRSGTYRVTKPIEPEAGCYWQISKDAEGTDIVKNDFVMGGTPQVTITKGQWFKTQGCGEWKPV